MKKNLSLLTLYLFAIACDDGDLAIETIDFDSITSVQSCNTISPTLENVLFKINTTEALILELPALAIENKESDSIEFSVTATGTTKITYRILSDNVTTAYFCENIPLTEPTVINEIIAEGGTVLITTTLNADSETYNHAITLRDISLVTSQDSRITDLSIDVFGDVTTQKEVTTE